MADKPESAERKRAEAINERNQKVSSAVDEICKVARLSPTGKHGIDFFDTIMAVYLAGEENGKSVAALAVEREREACAKIADAVKNRSEIRFDFARTTAAKEIGDKIRARDAQERG